MHYRAAVENANDAIALADEHRFLYVNPAFLTMFGYEHRDEVQGQPPMTIIHPDDRERVMAAFRRRLGGGDVSARCEFKGVRTDGSIVYVEASVARTTYAGEVVALSYLRDVTDRKRTEQQIQTLNEQLQAVVRASPVAIVALDTEDRVTLWSSAAEAMFGWKEKEVLGKQYPIVPEDYYASSEANRQYVLAGNTHVGVEVRRQRKDGTLIDLSLSSAPLRNAEGEITGLMTILEDITERKQMEQEREEVLRRNQALVDALGQIVYDWRPRTDELFWDGDYTKVLGYSSEEIGTTTESWTGRVHPDDLETVLAEVERATRERCTYDLEYRFRHRNGSYRWMHDRGILFVNAQGELERIIGVFIDITDRKQTEAELKRQARRLELVHRIDSAILHAESPDEIVRVGLDRIHDFFRCWRVSLAIYDPDTEQSVILATSAKTKTEVEAGMSISGPPGWDTSVLRDGDIFIARDVPTVDDPPPVLRRLVDEGLHSFASVPLLAQGKLLGVLNLAYDTSPDWESQELDVAREIGDQLAIALYQARMREQLHALAEYLQEAREEERARLARDIHDDLGQALTAIKFDISRLKQQFPEDASELYEQADEISALVDSTIQVVRRVLTELRPGILDDLGLVAAIEWQVHEFSNRTGIRCTSTLKADDTALPQKLATTLFRICQEALTNVARHAGATHVHVSLETRPEVLVLTVRDNGRGIDEHQLSDSVSLGLQGMRERARPWGGDVTFETNADAGTTVTASIPRKNTHRNYT